MKQLIITNRATEEINKAKKWYNKQQENLGYKFADYIFNCFNDIQKHPLSHASKHKYTRELVVKKYPYIIIYTIEEEIIFILRVFPCRTNPKKKYKTIKK